MFVCPMLNDRHSYRMDTERNAFTIVLVWYFGARLVLWYLFGALILVWYFDTCLEQESFWNEKSAAGETNTRQFFCEGKKVAP